MISARAIFMKLLNWAIVQASKLKEFKDSGFIEIFGISSENFLCDGFEGHIVYVDSCYLGHCFALEGKSASIFSQYLSEGYFDEFNLYVPDV